MKGRCFRDGNKEKGPQGRRKLLLLSTGPMRRISFPAKTDGWTRENSKRSMWSLMLTAQALKPDLMTIS